MGIAYLVKVERSGISTIVVISIHVQHLQNQHTYIHKVVQKVNIQHYYIMP
jgi:hypothetical protein